MPGPQVAEVKYACGPWQGFIQNFSVGWVKHVHRAMPPRGVWGDAHPGNIRNLHALRLLLVASGSSKMAGN